MKRHKKLKKPHADFPLFPHASGQWAKKVLGHLHYFGTDPDAALNKWLAEKDELLAGHRPRDHGEGLKLMDLCNKFLTSKKNKLAAGELASRTWGDYFRICETILDFFGKDRRVLSLGPDDFERFRAKLAASYGVVTIASAVLRARVVFKWGFDNEHIDRPVRFGTAFDRPSRKVMRRAKREGGSRVFEADEIRRLIDAAHPRLKAMILIGINCGFGQSDLANLPLDAIDLAGAVINFPRPKTEIVRRCPLWKETCDAISDTLADRPRPQDPADRHLAFLTRGGVKWVREYRKGDVIYFGDYISVEFNRLAVKLGIKRRGSFYNLRHSFRTVADASKDQPALDCIMGHTSGTMAEEYRERIGDDRLIAVTNVVRSWLWPKTADGPATIPFSAAVG